MSSGGPPVPVNPGIQRGITAVPHHSVVSVLHLGLPWDVAEGLAMVLDNALRMNSPTVPPSYLDGITELRDLLHARTRVLRSVTEEPSPP